MLRIIAILSMVAAGALAFSGQVRAVSDDPVDPAPSEPGPIIAEPDGAPQVSEVVFVGGTPISVTVTVTQNFTPATVQSASGPAQQAFTSLGTALPPPAAATPTTVAAVVRGNIAALAAGHALGAKDVGAATAAALVGVPPAVLAGAIGQVAQQGLQSAAQVQGLAVFVAGAMIAAAGDQDGIAVLTNQVVAVLKSLSPADRGAFLATLLAQGVQIDGLSPV